MRRSNSFDIPALVDEVRRKYGVQSGLEGRISVERDVVPEVAVLVDLSSERRFFAWTIGDGEGGAPRARAYESNSEIDCPSAAIRADRERPE